MLNLNDREWKAFKVKHIFSIEKCKCSSVSTLKQGTFPYVGATNRNNGIMSFVEKKDKWVTKGNCIVFICDGQGSVGYSIYKKEDFIGSTTLKVGRSEHLNRYTAQFLVSALDKNRQMYSYGYKRNENRLSNESIMLPTTDDKQPDYAFMEQYIREREDKLKQKYIDFVNAELETPPVPLAEKTWGEFFIGSLFAVKRPKARSEKDYENGKYPFVASGNFNNGVIRCCEPHNETLDKRNCITVSPVDGSAFYQQSDFLGRGGAGSSVLLLYCDNINEYSGLFIARLIRQTCSKYNYGKMGNQDSIKREKILLPITDDGQPDYEYMEQYIKAVMFGKYKKYLEYQKCPLL